MREQQDMDRPYCQSCVFFANDSRLSGGWCNREPEPIRRSLTVACKHHPQNMTNATKEEVSNARYYQAST